MAGREGPQPGMGDKAHELRRPLGVARGFLDMLLEDKLGSIGDAQRTLLLRVQVKLDEALHSLEQELLLGRLDESFTPTMQSLELGQEIESAAERARVRFELAGGCLSVERPETAVTVRADRGLLARILDNLLDNAITHTDGAPRAKVQAGSLERSFVRVCDEGVGIDPELREQIFARGFRADPSGARPGSGLGLYLSRQAAQQMGAELALEWTYPGRGSCLLLQLRHADEGNGDEVATAS